MAQVIDLDGLPDPVAKAIAETVVNLKNRYRLKQAQINPVKDLPSKNFQSRRRTESIRKRPNG